ncbi:unnamed protein product [Paramecium sonneborni]|uniref:Cation-transporting P-type ATPase N-terminal domain-containing protein n=1 Tax=Paramecium sonneborni TaxID=65129 RepID=A0A8S1MZX5_9CILI|nr:unnamed protein product [Paramecium sonneborni]
MKKAWSRSASQIVTMFTQAQQEMELIVAKRQFDEMSKELKQRREQIYGRMKGVPKIEKKPESSGKQEKFKSMDEHKITLQELENKMQTNIINGIDTQEAEKRLVVHGKNQLTEKKQVPWYLKLLHELTSVFACMMWTGSALSFIAFGLTPEDPSNLYLAIVLAVVVTVTGIMAYFQNQKSAALMEAFKNFIPPETQVIRNGRQMKIPAENLVPGDLVVVEFGKRIPADIRIIESNGIKVDNSSLTGETLLLQRTPDCSHPENPLETKNLVFFGTLCKEGNGRGIVIFTGDNTVIGQIAGLAMSSGEEESVLRKQINLFVKMIAIIALICGIVFFILGMSYGYPALQNIILMMGIAVGYVPEGLIATVTVALSLTAKRLAQKKVLVKNLECVETLGSTSCICSDKTGTLTQNKMTVEHLWYNNKKVKGLNYQKFGKKYNYEYDLQNKGFQDLFECASFCSEAVFDPSLPQELRMKIQNDKLLNQQQKEQKIQLATNDWEIKYQSMSWLERPTIGDASESALIKFLQPIKDILETRNSKKLATDVDGKNTRMPFNSNNKYAFVILEYETEESFYCLMSKGAPERIWELCTTVNNDGNEEQKDENWEKAFKSINKSFGKNGERVLGFAKVHLPKTAYPKGYPFNLDKMNFPWNKQQFLGLFSLIDPPKDSVPDSVIKCKTAGVQVIMVTGDQPVTAASIAKQCNIITEKTVNEIADEEGISFEEAFHRSNAIVIHGDSLTKMMIDDEGKPESEQGRQLQEWLSKSQIVFARTSPAQKLIIVDGCQKKGHIVAVTGDGVNDSPAIKKADIGISMGITGSDVAKDAADMILLNDDFSNIVIGIEEGRKIIDNLKKTIVFVLTGNIVEVIPIFAYFILNIPLPLTTVLILCIDVGTGIIPSTAFVYEEAELDIMTRRPRNKEENLITPKSIVFAYAQHGFIQLCGCFLAYFVVFYDYGFLSDSLLGILAKNGVIPKPTDDFDPNDRFFGNTNLKNIYTDRVQQQPETVGQHCISDDETKFETIDWLFSKNNDVDLRMYYIQCNTQTNQWELSVVWGECQIDQISPLSNKPVCYSTEALQYAQTAYFIGLAYTQMCNYQSLKTHKSAGIFQGFNNVFMHFGFMTLIILVMGLTYVQSINVAFQTRDLLFQHQMLALPFGLLMQLWNEARKYMVRNVPQTTQTMPNWWARCTSI